MPKRLTPVDNITRMPLPIYPFSDIDERTYFHDYDNARYVVGSIEPIEEQELELCSPKLPDNSETDMVYTTDTERWHHAFHPEDQLKSNKKGALFLRNSRVQYVPRWLHKDYHHVYEGPPLTSSVQERFQQGVFSVAGYHPKVAIDVPNTVKQGEDVIIPLNFSEYKKMIHPEMLRGQFIEKRAKFREASKFMMGVILKQEVKTIDESLLEEFLLSQDRDRRIKIARFIFEQLADQSTEPFKDKYQKARKQKRIITRELPTPRDVVLTVTNPFIPESITKLGDKVLKEIAA